MDLQVESISTKPTPISSYTVSTSMMGEFTGVNCLASKRLFLIFLYCYDLNTSCPLLICMLGSNWWHHFSIKWKHGGYSPGKGSKELGHGILSLVPAASLPLYFMFTVEQIFIAIIFCLSSGLKQ